MEGARGTQLIRITDLPLATYMAQRNCFTVPQCFHLSNENRKISLLPSKIFSRQHCIGFQALDSRQESIGFPPSPVPTWQDNWPNWVTIQSHAKGGFLTLLCFYESTDMKDVPTFELIACVFLSCFTDIVRSFPI